MCPLTYKYIDEMCYPKVEFRISETLEEFTVGTDLEKVIQLPLAEEFIVTFDIFLKNWPSDLKSNYFNLFSFEPGFRLGQNYVQRVSKF